jgi:hypothetical protein
MRATPQFADRWSSPSDIQRELVRQWEKKAFFTEASEPGPYLVTLVGPSVKDFSRRLPEVQAWVAALEAGRTMGYEVNYATRHLRILGTNRIPDSVTFTTIDSLLDAIQKGNARQTWLDQVTAAAKIDPRLADWVRQDPFGALHAAEYWPSVLAVLSWLLTHPNSGLYLRQIDVPGVHSKFIESQANLIQTLVDVLHPRDGARGPNFITRFGLREKEALIQVRTLDAHISVGGLTQFATPVSELRQLRLDPHHVIITENETNGLTLPQIPGAVALFGRGYAVDMLAQIPWIANAAISYWGDLDTHGFAILDRVRAHLPHTKSFLMDETTLLAHRDHWGREKKPTNARLTRLTSDEQSVYASLVHNRYATHLRLEQEHIRYRHVLAWAKSLS